jgi:hypothetical protein
MDALLAKVGASVSQRVDCGTYSYLDGLSLDCLFHSAEQGASAELTYNWCVDCDIQVTYVTTPEDGFLSVLMEEDYLAADRRREARVESCSGFRVEQEATLVECLEPILLYQCDEPLLTR